MNPGGGGALFSWLSSLAWRLAYCDGMTLTAVAVQSSLLLLVLLLQHEFGE